MKIRNGFVSNSSSSSFILLLPNDFNVETCDISHFDELEQKVIKNAINSLLENEILYDYDLYDGLGCDDDNDIDLDIKDILTEILKEYIILHLDANSDNGSISIMSDSDIDKIKKILKV